MTEINNVGYIMVQNWMVSELNLSGNELLIYAVIYGFSQDGRSVFSGSLSYLAELLGLTKRGVYNALKRLVEKEYLIKINKVINGVRFCDYKAIIPDEVKK